MGQVTDAIDEIKALVEEKLEGLAPDEQADIVDEIRFFCEARANELEGGHE